MRDVRIGSIIVKHLELDARALGVTTFILKAIAFQQNFFTRIWIPMQNFYNETHFVKEVQSGLVSERRLVFWQISLLPVSSK